MLNNNLTSKGFVALTTTLIISFVMLSSVLITSSDGFRILVGVWRRHSKEVSFNLAQGCLDQAIVRILQNPNYQPLESGEIIKIEDFSCLIKQISYENSTIIIETTAEVDRIFTSLRSKVEFSETNARIISIEEI